MILEINTPLRANEIDKILFNGVDLGPVKGITRIEFVVVPGDIPRLVTHRNPEKKKDIQE